MEIYNVKFEIGKPFLIKLHYDFPIEIDSDYGKKYLISGEDVKGDLCRVLASQRLHKQYDDVSADYVIKGERSISKGDWLAITKNKAKGYGLDDYIYWEVKRIEMKRGGGKNGKNK